MKLRHPFRLVVCALLGSGLVLPGACVWRTEHKIETTSKIEAHIVLDIRQVKEEGSAVEGYVRGETATPPPATGGKPTSMLDAGSNRPWYAAFDLAGSACAATPQPMTVAAEDEKGAVERRRARAGQVEQGLNARQLGENDHGYLTVLSGDLKALTEAENADRKVIYQAIAERNKAGDQREAVEIVMAEAIREKLKTGQSFQAPRSAEAFARFQQSPLGKQYPAAKPGAWLEVK
jgi:uncharacterized protein YdbL (DUF1318 family)